MEDFEKSKIKIYMQPAIFAGEFVETGAKNKFLEISEYIKNDIIKSVHSLAESFYDMLKEFKPDNKQPDIARVEFGVQIDINGQVFIAQASANSSIKIILEWKSVSEK